MEMDSKQCIYNPFIPWAWFKSHWAGASHMHPINISQIDYQSPAVNSETKLFLTCVHRNGRWQLNSLLPKGRGKKWDWGAWGSLYHFTSPTAWYFTLLFCPIGIHRPKYPIRIQRLVLVRSRQKDQKFKDILRDKLSLRPACAKGGRGDPLN